MYIFFGFDSAKIIEISTIWQNCSYVYTATFYEPQQKCSFWFLQVRCAHKSGDVINFTIVACRIYSRLKPYKKCKNRLRLAKVIVKNKMSRFYGSLCICTRREELHLKEQSEFTKLCTFGDELRVTGSTNMASDVDRTIASVRRFNAVKQKQDCEQ